MRRAIRSCLLLASLFLALPVGPLVPPRSSLPSWLSGLRFDPSGLSTVEVLRRTGSTLRIDSYSPRTVGQFEDLRSRLLADTSVLAAEAPLPLAVAPAHPSRPLLAQGTIFTPTGTSGAPAQDPAPLVPASVWWNVTLVNAPAVWARTAAFTSPPVVAVVDTGVDPHPEILSALLPGVNTLDPGNLTSDTSDVHGHGTHVAGIIAAANDSSGTTGVAPMVKILPVKALGDDGSGSTSTVAAGIIAAYDRGADVVNLSLGGPEGSEVLRSAIEFVSAAGVVVVASAGNDGTTDSPSYPAAYDEVIAVAASSAADKVASFSNRGSWVDISAPGVAIASLHPGGGFAYRSGTSMAAPHVAGLAALLRAAAPSLSPVSLREILLSSAVDIESPGPDPLSGAGRVAFDAAFDALDASLALPPPTSPATTLPPPVIEPVPAPVPDPAQEPRPDPLPAPVLLPPAPQRLEVAVDGRDLLLTATPAAGMSFDFFKEGVLLTSGAGNEFRLAGAALRPGPVVFSVRAVLDGVASHPVEGSFTVTPPPTPRRFSVAASTCSVSLAGVPRGAVLRAYRDGSLLRTLRLKSTGPVSFKIPIVKSRHKVQVMLSTASGSRLLPSRSCSRR